MGKPLGIADHPHLRRLLLHLGCVCHVSDRCELLVEVGALSCVLEAPGLPNSSPRTQVLNLDCCLLSLVLANSRPGHVADCEELDRTNLIAPLEQGGRFDVLDGHRLLGGQLPLPVRPSDFVYDV